MDRACAARGCQGCVPGQAAGAAGTVSVKDVWTKAFEFRMIHRLRIMFFEQIWCYAEDLAAASNTTAVLFEVNGMVRPQQRRGVVPLAWTLNWNIYCA